MTNGRKKDGKQGQKKEKKKERKKDFIKWQGSYRVVAHLKLKFEPKNLKPNQEIFLQVNLKKRPFCSSTQTPSCSVK